MMHVEEPGRPVRVLVVDDDPTSRLALVDVLESAGHDVAEAEGGDEALARVRRGWPDVILLDVLMPGKDGFQTCSEIRRLPEGAMIPILMITGLNDTESVEKAFEVGATDFTPKPVSAALVTHRIRYMLRNQENIERLFSSERSLERAQHVARLGEWVLDSASGAIRGSEEFHRILGVTSGTAPMGLSDFLDRVHPDDSEEVARVLGAARSGDAAADLEHRLVLEDGEVRWVHTIAKPSSPRDKTGAEVLGTLHDITDRVRVESRIRYLAMYDALTGLPNRYQFVDLLNAEIGAARRQKRILAVMSLDLDGFKRINDTLGHSAGDRLLQMVAKKLRGSVRGSDVVAREDQDTENRVVARLGGDEFILFFGDLTRGEDAAHVARRLVEAVRVPMMIDEREVFITASVGIGLHPQDGSSAEELLKNADSALSSSKRKGKDQFRFYDHEMNTAAFHRLAMEGALRRAIKNEELVLHFQPLVEVPSGRMVGAEVLLRWRHPDLGVVPPAQFLGLAEETGLIESIGSWVLGEAARYLARWRKAGLDPVRLSVNVSGTQFRNADLAEMATVMVREAGVEPGEIELEITETVLMEKSSVGILHTLKERGFRLAVDDFGTGYSSLACLKTYPLDVLKIDRSFIQDIAVSPDDAAIVRAIVLLATSLKLETVAEGVETEYQKQLLEKLGCFKMQGYLFGKPVPSQEFEWLLSGSRIVEASIQATPLDGQTVVPGAAAVKGRV